MAKRTAVQNADDKRAGEPVGNSTSAPATEAAAVPTPLSIGKTVVTLWPLIVGLAFARSGIIASNYGSYRATDENIFTDGSMIVALLVMLIPFAIITASKKTIPKAWVTRIAWLCMGVEVLSIFAIGLLDMLCPPSDEDFSLHFAVSVVCTLSASGSMFYWLRRMRGTGTVAAVIFVFAALALSEVELLITSMTPRFAGLVVAGILAAVQFPCMAVSHGRAERFDRDRLTAENAFPGFDERTLKNRQLLIAMSASIALLAVVAGYLRGYPNGEAIPLDFGERAGYALLVIALSAITVQLTVGKHKNVMPMGFFLLLEIIACAALICFAAFPDNLGMGALFTTVLNALMVGLAWYIIVAFASFGWRDPYYYALAGWFIWLGARSLTRVIFVLTTFVVGNLALAIAVAGALVTLSAQVTFGMFLVIERRSADVPVRADENPSTIVRIIGLDQGETLASVREKSMRHSAEIMGKQFLLSEREVEVLSLYALGFTQKKVAEELYITQSTAHEHIKRIYAKTGLHSRQEILDYIAQYAS